MKINLFSEKNKPEKSIKTGLAGMNKSLKVTNKFELLLVFHLFMK